MRSWIMVTLGLLALTPAQGEGAAPPVAADLGLVRGDVWLFVSVRPAALLAGEPWQDLARAEPHALEVTNHWLDQLSHLAGGVPVAEMERVTLLFGPGERPAWVITTARPVDRAALVRTLGQPVAGVERHGARLHAASPGHAVAFVSPRTYLLGPRAALESVLDPAAGPPQEPLAGAMRRADRDHLVAAVCLARPEKGPFAPGADLLPGGEATVQLLRQFRSGRMGVHFDRTFTWQATATFATPAHTQAARRLLEAGRTQALRDIDELGEVLADRTVPLIGPRLARDVLAFYRAATPALRDLRIGEADTTLTAGGAMPGRGAFWGLGALLVPVARSSSSDRPPGGE